MKHRPGIRVPSALLLIMGAPPDAPANPLAVEWLRVVLDNNEEPDHMASKRPRFNPVCLDWYCTKHRNNPPA